MRVEKDIDLSAKLSDKQLAMLQEMENSPVSFDSDSLEQTIEDLKEFQKVGNKKRITMYDDTDVIDYYKKMAEESDIPYQTLMNMCLKQSVKDAAHLDFVWNKPA